MLGAIVSRLALRTSQCGFCARSRGIRIRCPVRHGQSKASHFGFCIEPTRIAVFDGSLSGTSSACSTVPIMYQLNRGSSQCHHRMGFTATPVLKMVLSYPYRVFLDGDCRNAGRLILPNSSRFRGRESERASRSAVARGRTQLVAPASL